MGRGEGLPGILKARDGQSRSLKERSSPEHIAGQCGLGRCVQRRGRQVRRLGEGRHGWVLVKRYGHNSELGTGANVPEINSIFSHYGNTGAAELMESPNEMRANTPREAGYNLEKSGPATPGRPAYFVFGPMLSGSGEK
jgi:hypothetical protein